ncbi:MAG: dTMP kinase [Thermoplasmata archaeon]|nr:dTMP kinase [Thermoplasmata archaeon]
MTRSSSRRGLLVFIEGIDGAGKSTLARRLGRHLRSGGVRTSAHQEPSDPAIGAEAVRRAPRDPLGAALLFTLDRSLARPRVERLLQRNAVVLQDRSYFSTLAYQGAKLGAPLRELLLEAQQAASPAPDVVLWLDLPVAEALRRVRARGQRTVLEKARTLASARRSYQRLSRASNWVRLDATASPTSLADGSARVLLHLLRSKARRSRGGR